MSLALQAATVLAAIVLAVVVHVFLRALSARLMTGKWPHQSDEAERIYRKLP